MEATSNHRTGRHSPSLKHSDSDLYDDLKHYADSLRDIRRLHYSLLYSNGFTDGFDFCNLDAAAPPPASFTFASSYYLEFFGEAGVPCGCCRQGGLGFSLSFPRSLYTLTRTARVDVVGNTETSDVQRFYIRLPECFSKCCTEGDQVFINIDTTVCILGGWIRIVRLDI